MSSPAVIMETTKGTNEQTNTEQDMEQRRQQNKVKYEKELTVMVEIDGAMEIGPMELVKAARLVCGQIIGCRQISKVKYELTLTSQKAKERLLDGFRIGSARLHVRDITNDELVVSFMGLPVYIEDGEIIDKLLFWGVTPISEVRRKMWPTDSNLADGTRYVKVRFGSTVQSLPYSVKLNTAAGPEYFRVIHDRQVRVCRGCLQPDHILRECPDFLCNNCGQQGHYARECAEPRMRKCKDCSVSIRLCSCRVSSADETDPEGQGGEDCGKQEGEGDGKQREGTRNCTQKENIMPTRNEPNKQGAVTEERASGKGGTQGPAPDQREGARKGPASKAPVEEVEPGVRVDDGPDPHLASERGEVVQSANQTPRPDKSAAVAQSPQPNAREMRPPKNKNPAEGKEGGAVRFRSLSEDRARRGAAGDQLAQMRFGTPATGAVEARELSSTDLTAGDDSEERMDVTESRRKRRQNTSSGKAETKKKPK